MSFELYLLQNGTTASILHLSEHELEEPDSPVVTEDKPPREISPDKITLLQKLGEGQFGEVS